MRRGMITRTLRVWEVLGIYVIQFVLDYVIRHFLREFKLGEFGFSTTLASLVLVGTTWLMLWLLDLNWIDICPPDARRFPWQWPVGVFLAVMAFPAITVFGSPISLAPPETISWVLGSLFWSGVAYLGVISSLALFFFLLKGLGFTSQLAAWCLVAVWFFGKCAPLVLNGQANAELPFFQEMLVWTLLPSYVLGSLAIAVSLTSGGPICAYTVIFAQVMAPFVIGLETMNRTILVQPVTGLGMPAVRVESGVRLGTQLLIIACLAWYTFARTRDGKPLLQSNWLESEA